MNYKETMDYIMSTGKFGSNLGLERTEKILELLGNPHKKLKCVHIAGTNGKGSTTAMVNNVLIKAGYRVGMYISPYLEEFEERMQINGQNISHEDLSLSVTKVAETVVKVLELGYDNPTEFEIITCAMFLYFYEKNVDYAVIEVGLGGRLDSTNVITPMLSVITSISFDHMKILGDTLDKIAYEKAGIIKAGVPVVTYPQKEEALKVIKDVCKERKSELIEVKSDCVTLINVSDEEDTQKIGIVTDKDSYVLNLPLLGKHQLLNCATAVHVVENLIAKGVVIEKQHILEGIRTVKWPGRMEVMRKNPKVVIDGAHNIDGISKLRESIDVYFKYKKLVLVLGILADKEVEKMVKTIVPAADKVIITVPHSERAEEPEKLKEVVLKYNKNCEIVIDYETAYKKALEQCGKDDLVIISGSLYMIGDMRGVIRRLS